ncbi:hypothetical protein AeNC1_008689 [Aphanomyces euteiches]|nr:hypothetical protein AeNC1_008689 [Aphanomyces euteiches]
MSPSASKNVYMTYYGTFVWENLTWCWVKLLVRCALTLFILRVLWARYCRHYLPLLRGLQEIGIDDKYGRYEVIVGDPTYLILSYPWVSIVMMADILTTPPYIAWSALRVCQYNDLIAFSLGCLYSTRFVWYGYMAMRCLSYIAKKRRWESKFTPIDPGVLGFGVLLYSGPVLSLIGTTPMMAIFQMTWTIFLPSALETQGTEFATGMIGGAVMMASFPDALQDFFTL